jgi:hypothetical protein
VPKFAYVLPLSGSMIEGASKSADTAILNETMDKLQKNGAKILDVKFTVISEDMLGANRIYLILYEADRSCS